MSQVTVAETSVVGSPRRLPRVRSGYRVDVEISGTAFGFTITVDDRNCLGTVDIDHSKHGTFSNGLTAALAELLSTALAHGMTVNEFVHRFLHTRFEPFGITSGDPDIDWASSPMDYLARRLAIDFLPLRQQVELGITRPNSEAPTW
ncbi:TSCPD domain-containing protein [Saccharomonospora saliphila]|uniref:TSCPD domain-containing protein n=1 Tax=Saccharomonospora saliphila TaxID=369829 RepID=UPI0003677F08|nr:hypothetical protein [Saccharomonospora saliphila]